MSDHTEQQPFDLALELLHGMRYDITAIRQTLAEHSQQLIGIRQQIHALEGNTLRIEENRCASTYALGGSKSAPV